jgi:hypothetical protein
MSVWRSLQSGLKALSGKAARNDEIGEELRGYIDDAANEKVRRGLSPEEAMRQARAEVGSMETVKHKVWSAGWESKAELFWNDLMYILRRLMRAPGLVFTVVVSMGLGVAANSTIFSLISKYVLAPAPVGDPNTLTMIYRTYDNGACCNGLPMPAYRDLRDQAKSFSGVSAFYELVPASIGGGSEPERVWGQATTANYFDIAQLHMTAGRGFVSSEEKSPVVVLGYELWRRHFNSDPAIVGKPVVMGGLIYTVVGVAPKDFRGLELILDPQYWVPLGTLSQLTATAPNPESRTTQWLRVAARWKPGVTEVEAAAEMPTYQRDRNPHGDGRPCRDCPEAHCA